MKKFLAIALLFIQVIGIGGYRLFFEYFDKQASVQFAERIDGGVFSEKELIEIKIPYPLPYAANRGEYERFDGEIEMNGIHYNYVKRKMFNDTLYLLCIPNSERNELNAAKEHLIAGLSEVQNDHNAPQNSPGTSIVKPFTTDYFQFISEFLFSAGSDNSTAFQAAGEIILPSATISGPFQPPKA